MQNQLILTKRILPLIDLTSLNDNDDDDTIKELCHRAVTSQGRVAAVCVYPQFVLLAKECLFNSGVKIATVVNFPYGDQQIDTIWQMTKNAIEDGANEIDTVIPYKEYLMENTASTKDLVKELKNICGSAVILKTILETGALLKPEIIATVSRDVILSGADFLKTSTGKIPIGATIEAADTMLRVIHDMQDKGYKVGFKASGGIRTVKQAAEYLQIADNIMGPDWISPQTFRFGASGLLNDVLGVIDLESGY
jgi:deoxyribose-phosphate aldolase